MGTTLLRTGLTGACLVLAAGIAVEQSRSAIVTEGKGLDFAPLRSAGAALVHGLSIYADRRFVYPPTAAVALIPTTLGRYAAALDVWLVVSAAAVGVAGLIAIAPWRGALWPLLSALGACILLKSDVLTDTLWLGNLSLLLAPVAVGVLLLFEARHWRTGIALLMLSLLIKPLLIPLVLIPLLQREWRPLADAIVVAAVLLGAAILLVPGGGHFVAVIGYLDGGSSLRGAEAVYNISIHGLAQRFALGAWATAARVIVIATAAGIAVMWARRPASPGSVAAMGALLLLAFLLAGSLSEDHYLLVAAPCVLAALALSRKPLGMIGALPGLLLVAFPRHEFGNVGNLAQDLQIRYFLAEVALAVAAAMIVWESMRVRRAPGAHALATERGQPVVGQSSVA